MAGGGGGGGEVTSPDATPSGPDPLVRPPWAQRKFAFVHPPWMVADFVERLCGVVPRLDLLLDGVDDAIAHRSFGGKWSIAQNVGHLSDVEELWHERLEDLRQGRATFTAALPARFQAAAARHQQRPLRATLDELAERRAKLVAEHDDHHLLRVRELRAEEFRRRDRDHCPR
ncbi:MAG: hypothetical protein EXS13_05420 [Planctomycetes bacterium]|nr:hypothetical protein [Planctomycetota bacterium]